jgi:hypothetical protein
VRDREGNLKEFNVSDEVEAQVLSTQELTKAVGSLSAKLMIGK